MFFQHVIMYKLLIILFVVAIYASGVYPTIINPSAVGAREPLPLFEIDLCLAQWNWFLNNFTATCVTTTTPCNDIPTCEASLYPLFNQPVTSYNLDRHETLVVLQQLDGPCQNLLVEYPHLSMMIAQCSYYINSVEHLKSYDGHNYTVVSKGGGHCDPKTYQECIGGADCGDKICSALNQTTPLGMIVSLFGMVGAISPPQTGYD
jgi:hypothetical protein